jgi:pimeloyl-ACP methyl ester carboxylesterase
MAELEKFFRAAYAPLGIHTDAEWRHLAETSVRRTDDGLLTPHYDPKIVQQFTGHSADYDLWPDFDRIRARTLCLRGIDSDLLTPEVADEMTERGPRARLAVIPGCGHAPALNTLEQQYLVESFFAEPA